MLARRLIILGGKPTISFPSTAILASATVGTAVGTATIRGKVKGTASWSLADSAGGKYAINSSTGAVTVNGALSAGIDSITISVSGLTPAVKNAIFSIGVVSAPVNSVAPAITGTSAVGFTLSCSTGTWSNNAYNTYSYQWKMDGSNVGGATSSTYVPVSGDTGKVPTCVVTATNIASNANATSNSASAVLGTPTNSSRPTISGTPAPGNTETSTNGTWTSSPSSYAYQWYYALLSGGSPVLVGGLPVSDGAIPGATNSTYVFQSGDLGKWVFLGVVASNIVGSSSEAVSDASGPVSTEDSATTAWVNAVVGAGGTVSSGRRSLVDALIVGLKGDGVWSKLDRLGILAAENTQSALIDLVARSSATPQSSPSFTTDRGYTGDGATSYVDTGFAPNAGTNFLQNSAHFSVYTRTTGIVGQQRHGVIDASASNGCYVSVNDSGNSVAGINVAFDNTVQTAGTAPGHAIGNRSGASAVQLYSNGASIATGSTASTAPVSDTIWLCGRHFGSSLNQGGQEQVSAWSVGGSLSGTDASNLYSRLQTFLHAIGAV